MTDIADIRRVYRDNCVRILAVTFCRIAGIPPVDPVDGSCNYWMFYEEAEKTADTLAAKFPIPDSILAKRYEAVNQEKR